MGALTPLVSELPRAHVPPVGRIAELLSANVPVATNCWVPATKMEGVAGVTAIETSGLFTTWIKKSEVLVRKLPSPLYTAVTTCSPGERLVVAGLVAIPPDMPAGEPKFTPSTTNCTVPVGVPAADDTVPVKLTESPTVEGFSEEVTTTVAVAGVMVIVVLAIPFV
jgi:hypothetical protein